MLQAEHLDEGTLHAFLDGELDSDQQAEVERHLADCAECSRNADGTRSMLLEADDLIERLDPPPVVMLPEGRSMGGGNRMEPVVLIPPEPETPRPGPGRPYRAPAQKRPKRPFAPPRTGRRVLIAAGLAAVAGIGYLTIGDGDDAARDVQLASSPAPPEPTMSSFERAPAPVAGAADGAEVAEGAEVADSGAGDSAGVAEAGAAGGVEVAAADEGAEARSRAAAPPARPAPARQERSAAQIAADRQAAADLAQQEAERDVAARTQAILEETAAQQAPAQGGAAAARAAQAAAPDAASALERRAGVYSRIGLDEARRMLGSPAHAILDLRPQFVGLAASSGVPGADPGRPLVRVVYLDPSQRLIMLDQQRQSGDLPQSTDNLIVMARGGVRLWLHGAVPPATLRDLAERVR